MKNKLEKLYKREGELLYQIDGIANWAGLSFCDHQLKELKKVREQIAALKGQD